MKVRGHIARTGYRIARRAALRLQTIFRWQKQRKAYMLAQRMNRVPTSGCGRVQVRVVNARGLPSSAFGGLW